MIKLNAGVHHAATVRCKISEAQIRKHSKDPRVTQLKDERYSLYFIYRKDRRKGSWRYIHYSNGTQKGLVFARYPKTSASQAIELLKQKEQEGKLEVLATSGHVETVHDVLDWYISRQREMNRVQTQRVTAIKSMYDTHLYSMFEGMSIAELTHETVDDHFVVPFLSMGYSTSYARALFQLLKAAFNTAVKMKKIYHNPMSAMVWNEFVSDPIKPKPSRLMPQNIVEVSEQISKGKLIGKTLCIMMLFHGTRIGETRQAKWCHINFETKQWFIPERNTKTKRAMVYPLSDDIITMLREYKSWLLDNHYKGNNVFPHTKRDKAPVSKMAANDLVREISNKRWSAHDLRKLARTIWADIGIDYLVAESLLNHAKDKLDQTYIHSHVEHQKKEALNTYHKWLKNCWRTCVLATFST